MKNIRFLVLAFSVLFMFAGCTAENHSTSQKLPAPVTMKAVYTNTPITVDGRLDEAVWKTADTYAMNLPDDRATDGTQLEEGGQIRLAWDKDYFYVGIRFSDSDIVAEGQEDQLMHHLLGDLCELFLKPADQLWYWELYVTPRGNKSSFWFPGRGRFGLPGNFKYDCGLKVAAQCAAGTLNDWEDTDKYWTAEMAMPVKDLTARGEKFGPDADWYILAARYNYSRYLKSQAPEYSTTPKLSKTNFHLLEEYAVLELVKSR